MPFVNEPGSNAPTITLKVAQEALRDLLSSESLTKEYWSQRDTNECVVGAHPFGLDTSIPSCSFADTDVHLIAHPGATDVSVAAMKLMIGKHLPSEDRVPGQFRLRIVRIRLDNPRHDNPAAPMHDLYFELVTGCGTFVCGGCNDYSGTGGSGGRELERIFNLVAAMYDIPIEEVVLSEAEAKSGVKLLHDSYDEFQARRRAA